MAQAAKVLAEAKIKQAQALLEEAKQLAIQNQLDLTFDLGADAKSAYDDGPFKFEFQGAGEYPDTDWRPGGWVGSSYNC